MYDIFMILFSMLAVFGFYCALTEIRQFLVRISKKKNNCAKKHGISFDKKP